MSHFGRIDTTAAFLENTSALLVLGVLLTSVQIFVVSLACSC